jgi:hypothetical protein
MPQTTPPPRHSLAPIHTTESPWRDSAAWNKAHRVRMSDRLVLCIGQRTMDELYEPGEDRPRCTQCANIEGPSAL